MKYKLTKHDVVAEKFGISKFCVNCNHKIVITFDEADYIMTHPLQDNNLWIHKKTNLRCCFNRDDKFYAFPRKESKLDGIEE